MLHLPRPDGVAIAVHDLGGTGPPLLLVHATGFHGRVWAPFARELPAGVGRSQAVDLRGHGASGPLPAGPVTWGQSADDVLAVVEALAAPAPLRAVGHSMGGAVLLMAEARRPGTFSSIYAYEPIVVPADAGGHSGAGRDLASGARRRRPAFPSKADALDTYRSKPPLSVLRADALAAYVEHGFVAGPDGAVVLACAPEDEARTFEAARHAGALEVLGAVRVPVAVATGRLDPGPATWAASAASLLPRGAHHAFPQLGHLGPLEDPAAVAADVAAWMG